MRAVPGGWRCGRTLAVEVPVPGGAFVGKVFEGDEANDCWGSAGEGQLLPPAGPFTALEAGGGAACGLRADGSLACWGAADLASVPAGTFLDVSVGSTHACSVRSDHAIVCWGEEVFGEASPPDEAFDSVSAGDLHTCGVRTDGRVSCWGDDYDG